MTNQELTILKKVINNDIQNKEENIFSRETLFKYYNLLKEAGHEIVLTSDVDRVIAEKAIEVFGKEDETRKIKKRFENGKDYIEFEVQEKIEKIDGIPEDYKKYNFKLTYCINEKINTVLFVKDSLNIIDKILIDVKNLNLKEVF